MSLACKCGMLCALAALLGVACNQQPQRAAVAVAPPVIDAPIGPWPGLATGEEDNVQPANPFTGNTDALAEGRRFFVSYNCAGCHGDHGGGGMGPSLRDASWIYGGSDVQIADSIAEGRAYGMPAWERMLTPAQIWQMTAYLRSMRTPEEPQPPLLQ